MPIHTKIRIFIGTCKRYMNVGRKTIPFCRFGFPRQMTNTTKLNLENRPYSHLPGMRGKLYNIQRSEHEIYINDYNPPILSATNANMDIQFVSDIHTSMIDYVTAYSSKGENKCSSGKRILLYPNLYILEDDNFMDGNIKSRGDLFKVALQYLWRRKMGTLEACDRLYGHSLYEFDLNIQFLNTNSPDKRTKSLKTLKQIQDEMKFNSNPSPFRTNFVDDYYPNRPKDLENYSLFNLYCNYE